MAITLSETLQPCLIKAGGESGKTLSAGKRLQMRDNETGEVVDFLDVTVPAGKSWAVDIDIQIRETDV